MADRNTNSFIYRQPVWQNVAAGIGIILVFVLFLLQVLLKGEITGVLFYTISLLLLLAGSVSCLMYNYHNHLLLNRRILEWEIQKEKECLEDARQKMQREYAEKRRISDLHQQHYFRLIELCRRKEKTIGQRKAEDGKVYDAEIGDMEYIDAEVFEKLWKEYKNLLSDVKNTSNNTTNPKGL